MATTDSKPSTEVGTQAPAARPLPEAARRALAEAEQRRLRQEASERPAEHDGRGGLEPVRYGDWEVKGIASDF